MLNFLFESITSWVDVIIHTDFILNKGCGKKKDGNHGSFIGSNFIFCYIELEIFALYKSVSGSEATFIIYFEPIASEHVVNVKFL